MIAESLTTWQTGHTLKGHNRCDLYCSHIIYDCWIARQHFKGVTIQNCNSRTWLKEIICSRRVMFLWAHFWEWQGDKNGNHIFCWNTNFPYTVQFWESDFSVMNLECPFISDLLTLICYHWKLPLSLPSNKTSLCFQPKCPNFLFFPPGKFCNSIDPTDLKIWKKLNTRFLK